jgi:hypothetical protein
VAPFVGFLTRRKAHPIVSGKSLKKNFAFAIFAAAARQTAIAMKTRNILHI